jgi:hypothetical protein
MSRSDRTIPDIDIYIPELPEEIAPALTPLEIPETKHKGKFRRSGHLTDQMLKYNYPDNKNAQPSLFELLEPGTKEKIISSGANVELTNRKGEGIKLTKGEYKLILSLSKLLHDKSQNKDSQKNDYYTGNKGAELIPIKTKDNGRVELKSPKIAVTLYELAKEFYGGKVTGGSGVKEVARMLYDLAENPDKKALIKYTRIADLGSGKTREYFIEIFDSLLKLAEGGYKDFLNGELIDERREIVVNLHPIFIDQIENKYIELPLDITKRMIEAYGSHSVSEIAIKLIEYLARAHSGRPKDYKTEIYQEKLYWTIAEEYMKQGRRSLLEKYFLKGIETAKGIGLLKSYKLTQGTTGKPKIIFQLEKVWE